MSCVREHRAPLAALLLALGAAAVLAAEARRPAPAGSWRELSAGLGLGSRAGVATGFFDYDPRLESARDGALGPLRAARVAAGEAGALTFAPLASGGR